MAFTVDAVRKLDGFSSSSLPEVDFTIRDAETVCQQNLALFQDAPEPVSSSEPFDIDPTAEDDEDSDSSGLVLLVINELVNPK